MTDSLKEMQLGTIACGSAEELFRRELARVAENIDDANTSGTAKRSITITITFQPLEDRTAAVVAVAAKSSICPVKPQATTVFLSRRGGRLGIYEVNSDQVEIPYEAPRVVEKGAMA